MPRCCTREQQQLLRPLRVDLSACKYELLRLVAARLGWQVVSESCPDWDLYWTDTSISQERLMKLEPTQRINHFFGMLELCRKRSMARSLAALAAAVPPSAGLDFFPCSWQLPNQLGTFLAAAKAGGKKRVFIVKPDAGCQGKGIRLIQGGTETGVLRALSGLESQQAVAQAYISKPLLIQGFKFDLRVYVLVADVDPLRLFIYREGLVRFCTTKHHNSVETSAAPAASAAAVAAGGCRCFELLGYDVLLDVSLKPWLIEVNHSPSFNTDSALDLRIKEQLLVDAVQL
eukprot:gene4902-5146_t